MNVWKNALNISSKFCLLIALLFVSISAQDRWTKLSHTSDGDLVSVFFTSSERGWIGGDNGYLAATSDGGKTWSKQILNITENINEIYFRNDDNGYVLAGSKIFISKDGGRSWRDNIAINRGEFNNLNPDFLSVRFSSRKVGWIVGALLNKREEVMESLLLKTEDSGETWRRIPLTYKLELYHLDFVNDDTGWIVGDKGLIIHTFDSGNAWTRQQSGVSVSIYNVDFRDSDFGTAVGSGGTILRTENGGATWSKIFNNSKRSLLRVSFVNDKTGWIVGAGGTIMYSEDKGRTWNQQAAPMPDSLFGLYADKKSGWAVGKKGLVIKYIK